MPTVDLAGSTDITSIWPPRGGEPSLCVAPVPQACHGTDWPPRTTMQRYAEDRRLGQSVPPSVTTWRPQDVRRQQDADAMARSQVTGRAAGAPVSPGPGCEGRDR